VDFKTFVSKREVTPEEISMPEFRMPNLYRNYFRSISNSSTDCDVDDIIQKFSTEINKYTAQVNSEVQTYVQNLQNNAQKFANIVSQQAKLQADYDKGLQILRGG